MMNPSSSTTSSSSSAGFTSLDADEVSCDDSSITTHHQNKSRPIHQKYTPPTDIFPYLEMGVLLLVGFSSALVLTGLFPYVAYMVVDFGAADNVDKAGYISGYITSAFLVGRMCTAYPWGRIADSYGRRPVACFGCLGVMVFSLLFGLSSSIEMAVLVRLAMGLANPLAGLVKTLVSEICGPVFERSGMAMTTGAWTLGLVLGPAVGGALARPVELYPSTFSEGSFFDDYPYFLPNAFTALVGFVALIMALLYLPETLDVPAKQERESGDCDGDSDCDVVLPADDENIGDVEMAEVTKSDTDKRQVDEVSINEHGSDGRSSGEGRKHTSFRELLRFPNVSHYVVGYFLISLVAVIYDEAIPLWCLSSIQRGGLEYTSREVGQIMSVVGIPLVIFTFLGYPRLAKKLGEVNCFKTGQLFAAIMCVGTVLLRYLPLVQQCCDENALEDDGERCRCSHHDYASWHGWVLQGLIVLCSSVTHMGFVMGFTSLFLLINRAVPAEKRASVNGLAMTVGSVAKAVGPILGSVGYAW